MPQRDGTGPRGMGPGQGGSTGSGMGRGQGGGGKGRMGGKALGPDGEYVCPQCGEKSPHQRGIPCFRQKCPTCGTAMVRA